MRVIGNDRSHLVIESARRGHGRALSARVLTVLLAACLGLAWAPTAAHAVTISAVLAPTSSLVNATATYGCTARTTSPNEYVPSGMFTFPPNTILTGVSTATITAVEQGTGQVYSISNVIVNQAAGTVSFNIGFPQDKLVEVFDLRVGGVVNASQPGAYSYSVTLTSSKFGATTAPPSSYTLVANATAVTVGAVTLGSNQPLTTSSYTVPVTLGTRGRLSGTTEAGANTIVVTFPASTTVPATPPTGSVTIDDVAASAIATSGRQVTLTLAAAQTLAAGTSFNVVFGTGFGLVNPSGGTYTLTVRTSAENGPGTSPGYSIVVLPYLTMTVDSTNVAFGPVDPGVTSTPRAVNVTVNSSASFTISRALSGDVARLGLVVTGAASGGLKPAGLATYADSYSITPPWTTDPGVALLAQVQYTAVQ